MYISVFLVCVIIAGTLSFITERIPTLIQETKISNLHQEAMYHVSLRQKVKDRYIDDKRIVAW